MTEDMRTLIDATNSPVTGAALYEADEHLWAAEQIAALKAGDIAGVDRDHLIQYLTEMTQSDYLLLESRLEVLFHHILKVEYQPDGLSTSWVATINEQQRRITRLLKRVPSLNAKLLEIAEECYPQAVKAAVIETKLSASRFPARLPWTVEQALAFECPDVPPAPMAPRHR